jgi:hypothetical protein
VPELLLSKGISATQRTMLQVCMVSAVLNGPCLVGTHACQVLSLRNLHHTPHSMFHVTK